MLNDPEYRRLWNEDFEYEMSLLVTDIILASKMTRTQLAKKMGTQQPSLSRAESGKAVPSWKYVRKLAKAAGVTLSPPTVDRRTAGTVYVEIK